MFRYNSITRFNSDLSRNTRPRRKSDSGAYALSHRKTESVSSSSSASPESPSMTLPYITTSSFQNQMDTKQPHPYRFEPSFSTWSSSSSVTSDDAPSFRASPIGFDYIPDHATSPSPSDTTYHPFEISMNNTLSAFPDSAQIFPGSSSPTISSSQLYKHYSNHGHLSGYSQYPQALTNGAHDVPDQFSIFDGMSSLDSTPIMGWETGSSAGPKVANGGYKLPTSNEFVRKIFLVFYHAIY